MPDTLVAVCEKESGDLYYMHSVDATEATRLGDYVYVDDRDKQFDDEQRAVARARAKGMGPPPHAEMLSEKDRMEMRRRANEVQMPMVTVPTDTPVVLHAGSVQAAERQPSPERSARQPRDEGKK